MKYLKITAGIFLVLAASRFIPHPPNFTSLLALSFYVPALLGIRYLPALIIAFIFTDFYIGFHSLLLFTWGSVIIIGCISKYFRSNIKFRLFGTLFGCVIFYLICHRFHIVPLHFVIRKHVYRDYLYVHDQLPSLDV